LKSSKKTIVISYIFPLTNKKAGIYPNPFQNNVNISFVSEQGKEIAVQIYDLSGTLIKCIQAGNLQSGENTIVWDTRNKNGIFVKPDTYICRIFLNNKVITEKMIKVP